MFVPSTAFVRAAAVLIMVATFAFAGPTGGTYLVEPVLAPGTPTLPTGFTSCGSGEPPAGPYLDLATMRTYEYDCHDTTAQNEDLASKSCRAISIGGHTTPLTGACAIVNSDETAGLVTKEILVAVMEEWAHVDHLAHSHETNVTHCPDGLSTLTKNGVTFAYVAEDCNVGTEDCLTRSYTAHGFLTRSGGGSAFEFRHHGSNTAC